MKTTTLNFAQVVLLALTSQLSFSSVMGAPTTAIVANGLGTTVMPPAAGIYNIQGGTIAGSNLFHSFSTFNLGMGDTANFNVTSGISNILARVTGGPSTIEGTITSTIGAGSSLSSANLFLINPAGVLFTANAQVNLGGSFVVSTANYVKFSDGTIFYGDANHPIQDAGLTAMPVSSFGFLTPTPSPVSFVGSRIAMASTQGIHVISGDISLENAWLTAPAGMVSMLSAGSSGEVLFGLNTSGSPPGSGFATANFAHFGTIDFKGGSEANINTNGGGGGSVVIRGGKLVVDNSSVTSFNKGPTSGGDVYVQAQELTVSSGGFIATDCFGAGSGGSVIAKVDDDLHITGEGSQISSNTDSAGTGGEVDIHAATVDLVDGDIFANVANNGAAGHGGAVYLSGNSLTMKGDAAISSLSNGRGAAGTVKLSLSGPLEMMDTSSIVADTLTAANGGRIEISARDIKMSGESEISANTLFSSGDAGDIEVRASSLMIEGTGTQTPDTLGITAQALTLGNAGSIDVAVATLSLSGGAVISSSSLGTGVGGAVQITCSQGQLIGASSMSASSALSDAGSVNIRASDSFTLSGKSSINTSAGLNGGNIDLTIGRLLFLDQSNIQAFAGNIPDGPPSLTGGNIHIDPQFVILNGSFISANDLSPDGIDGNIVNISDFFLSNESTLHATGSITTTAPDLDLDKGLVALEYKLIDGRKKLQGTCAQSIHHAFDTFVVVGRGGTESQPEELQPDFGMEPDPLSAESDFRKK